MKKKQCVETELLADENEVGIPESERLFRREKRIEFTLRQEHEKNKERVKRYHPMKPGVFFYLTITLFLLFYIFKSYTSGPITGVTFSLVFWGCVIIYGVEKAYFNGTRIKETHRRCDELQAIESEYNGRFMFDNATHGTARWISKKERAELLSAEHQGIIFSAEDNHYEGISDNISYRHFAVIAPTGTGKTQRFILPNIVRERNASQVVTDPSGEIYKLTSLYVKDVLRRKVRLLQPFNPKDSIFWNPLARIENMSQAKRISDTVVRQIHGKGTADPFWTQSASSLLASLIMLLKGFDEKKNWPPADEKKIQDLESENKHLNQLIVDCQNSDDYKQPGVYVKQWEQVQEALQEEKNKRIPRTYLSFVNIRRLMTYPTEDIKKLIKEIDKTGQITEEYMSGFGKATENTAGGIQATLATALKIYGDEDIREVSSKHNFDFDQLRNEKTTLYIVIPESKIAYASPYITLFYQQLLE
ncbi:MAG: type IV secretory system conjugative DNA transfer family protein, partial [Candidatus Margulisiibacteriota bacterium]